jgi:hypothetical protein
MHLDRRRASRDRRQATRLPSVFAVKSTFGGRTQLGQSEDVGPAGMTLRRPRGLILRPGSAITLWFELPGVPVEIGAGGIVVSDVSAGTFRRTGVQFTRLSPVHAAMLREHCEAGTAWSGDALAASASP